MTVNQRIATIIESKYFGNKSAFAKDLNISTTAVYKLMDRETGPKFHVIKDLVTKMNIDPMWLITGYGQMEQYKNTLNEPPMTYNKPQGAPYYDIDVTASPVDVFNNQDITPSSWVTLPGFEDCDFYCNLWGDSLDPLYKDGSIIACKRVSKDIIHFGKAHLVVTKDHRMAKILRKHADDDNGYVIARSTNEYYDDITIHRDQMLHLYIIKGSVKRNQI